MHTLLLLVKTLILTDPVVFMIFIFKNVLNVSHYLILSLLFNLTHCCWCLVVPEPDFSLLLIVN